MSRLMRVRRWLSRWTSRHGQSLTEYGLTIGLIVVVSVGAWSAAGQSVNHMFQAVADSLSSVGDEVQ